jgi:ribosomal protein S18 acetylase RimI-like enzyme
MRQIVIERAGPTELPVVRAMLEEYAAWVGADLSFQDFTRELRDLPGEYVPPRGGLYLARVGDDEAAGMIAFRGRSNGRAEMKRLFVRPAARGTGMGRQLVQHVIDAAREAGYTHMILDTLPIMQDAQRMYERFGFRDIAPYYDSPIPGTRYLELDLTRRAG